MSIGAGQDSFWSRLARGSVCEWHAPEWQAFAGSDWPQHIMDVRATSDFHAKQGRSTGRVVFKNEGERLSVYLKRHYQLSWWRGLCATLWPHRGWSPARREAANLEWAHSLGLSVPEILAVGEVIGPWCRLQSFLAIRELSGMIGLHEAIPAAAMHLPTAKFRIWKARLIRELARMTRLLHEQKTFHKDLYLCHFYIPREDTQRIPSWQGRVHLIYFHRLRRHGLTWRYWQIKDLSQLLFSSEMKEIDDRDRLLFLRLYAGSRRSAEGLLKWLRFKAGRYRRHNHKMERRQAA